MQAYHWLSHPTVRRCSTDRWKLPVYSHTYKKIINGYRQIAAGMDRTKGQAKSMTDTAAGLSVVAIWRSFLRHSCPNPYLCS